MSDVVRAPRTRARILLVCTGNTCRSPMAAALAVARLPDVPAELTSAGGPPETYRACADTLAALVDDLAQELERRA